MLLQIISKLLQDYVMVFFLMFGVTSQEIGNYLVIGVKWAIHFYLNDIVVII
jgi:hypothetical protein